MKDGEQYIVIDTDNTVAVVSGGLEALQCFMWGRRLDDFTVFCVEKGGLERFIVPSNLSLLVNKF